MANSTQRISIFQKKLDKQMIRGLTSIRMERNADQVKYKGGKFVEVPKITMDGLGNYSETDGYPEGASTFEYEPHYLQYDRGREFTVDVKENDESGYMNLAGALMGEFQRTKVVPEIDASRYSRIWEKAHADNRTEFYVPDSTTALQVLSDAIEDLQDVVGEEEPLTIYTGTKFYKALKNSKDLDKKIDVSTFERGGIKMKVKTFDDIPIVKVPKVRFKTEYTFGDNGFSPTALAMSMNFMVVADRALLAINKLDEMREFTPSQYQKKNSWLLQYRRHHDLIIPSNKLEGVYVSFEPITAPELTATIAVGSASGTTKFTATAGAGDTLGYYLGASGTTLGDLYGVDKADITDVVEPYTSGADITATAGQVLTMLEFDANGHVVKSKEVTLASGDIKA